MFSCYAKPSKNRSCIGAEVKLRHIMLLAKPHANVMVEMEAVMSSMEEYNEVSMDVWM